MLMLESLGVSPVELMGDKLLHPNSLLEELSSSQLDNSAVFDGESSFISSGLWGGVRSDRLLSTNVATLSHSTFLVDSVCI